MTELKADKSIDADDEEFHSAATILNQYLDEEMRYAISVFGSATATPEAAISDQ
jgi:hypothetical protein